MRSITDLPLAPEAHSERGPVRCRATESPEPRPIISVDTRGPDLQLFTARGFEWTRAQLPIRHLPAELEGFRILHLSDLHCTRRWDRAYDDLIARVEADPPDLILFNGDFVEDKHDHRPAIPVVRRIFSELNSRLGTVAVLGNHDGDLLGLPLAHLKLTMAGQRRLVFQSESAGVEIIGVAGVEREDLDPDFLQSLEPKALGTVRIVVSHYPDLVRRCLFLSPDIFLAGHTHGGQVCLPGRIPILKHDSLPRPLTSGIHRIRDTWLVVNRGFGFSSLPVRLFCPAEVIEIRLSSVATDGENGKDGGSSAGI